MEFDSVVRRRKSVRKFQRNKISFRFLMDAVDSANQGPFSGNHNHLKYLIVEDKEKIKEIAEACEQDWIEEAPALVLVCSDDSHLEGLYGVRGRVYSRQSAGAAIYGLMLKLSDIGIGSCWVGAYSDEKIRRIFDIPKDFQVEAIVPIGFSDDGAGKEKKKSLERSIYWEKWKNTRKPSRFEEREKDLTEG